MTPHWTLSTATLLSICALGASPRADSPAELLGIWMIPALLGLYGLGRTILAGLHE
jgi:hypothetical protein